ncbi:aminotransferase class IV [Sporomusa malonica]|uniref:Branched chain amino acid aminotransferase apoenzyme n=1 Tax=Sporomusa malonica TaxID=112901 RepID=A0A1W2CFB5_9FIRM|nr:aminotransferase class IV [Sporomusa malonica]SMC83937.1 branched chain amino acid aminotransferase apoenzyme [Sporomusa malonica]
MIIYFNGRLVSSEECIVSPLDHGFLYGHGLFETMRAYNGRIFRLQDHLKRLEEAAEYLGWPEIPKRMELGKAIDSVLKANHLHDASVRLTLSRGIGTARPDLASCGQPTVAVFASPLPQPLPPEGWQVAIVKLRRNLSSPLVRIKSANYLDNMLAKAEARRHNAQEAIMLNTDGFVAEGSMSNIFFVTGNQLVTPDDNSGILPGVTRRIIIELAQLAGIPVEIRQVNPEELAGADEIFLTSSIMEVIPVTAVNGQPIGDKPAIGAMTAKLQMLYRELAEKE